MKDVASGINRQEMLIQITQIAGAPVGNTVSILFSSGSGKDKLDQVCVRHNNFDYIISRDQTDHKHDVFTITEEPSPPSGRLPEKDGYALTQQGLLDMISEWAGFDVAKGVLKTFEVIENNNVTVCVDGQNVNILRMNEDRYSVFIDSSQNGSR